MPAITFDAERIVDRPLLRSHGLLGMGASMAVRRMTFARVGLFDVELGVGSDLRSGEECEFMYRALDAGLTVVAQAPSIVVVHWGARTWAGGAVDTILVDGFYGLMAGHGKHVRAGDWRALFVSGHQVVWLLWTIAAAVVQVAKPVPPPATRHAAGRVVNWVPARPCVAVPDVNPPASDS